MKRYLPKSLHLSSLLIILAIACSPLRGYKPVGKSVVTSENVQPIVNKNNSLLYKAKINLFSHYYSGLVVLKQTDSITSHLTFVTEIGMKMFDFEIKNGIFKLAYVFEPLNKPKVISLLENDMKLILLQDLLNKEATIFKRKNQLIYRLKNTNCYYYKTAENSRQIEKTTVKGNLFTKEKVTYLYNDSLSAKQIKLKHTGFLRLRIELTNIPRQIQP